MSFLYNIFDLVVFKACFRTLFSFLLDLHCFISTDKYLHLEVSFFINTFMNARGTEYTEQTYNATPKWLD